jgi:glycosyltransferase involved in cell wall biosynthesis
LINSRWLKILGPLLINNRILGSLFERLFSALILVLKWCKPSSINTLSIEVQNLIKRAARFSGEPEASPKEIVFVNRYFMQSQIGGVNFLIALMAFGLKSRGHKVKILCESPRPWSVTSRVDGVEVVGLRPRLFILDQNSPALYASWSNAVFDYFKTGVDANKRTNIFATIAGLETFGTEALPCQYNSICYLVTDHIIHKFGTGVREESSHRMTRFFESERHFLSSPSIKVLADSNAIVGDLSNVLRLPELVEKSSILSIGWPINSGISEIPLPKGRIVTCIGSVSFRKGTRTLVDAWLQIASEQEYSDCYLLICGPTSDDHKTESIIRANAKNSRIIRIQSMNEDEKSFILENTNLVVIPSKYESFGIVAVESMQKGCQILASNIGGLAEVLEGAAVFFEVGNSNELREKIMQCISGDTVVPRANIMERAKAFDFEDMLRNLEDQLN